MDEHTENPQVADRSEGKKNSIQQSLLLDFLFT
jgi:hypothetical protein